MKQLLTEKRGLLICENKEVSIAVEHLIPAKIFRFTVTIIIKELQRIIMS